MRRALQYCQFLAIRWDECAAMASATTTGDAEVREGKVAYAREHAALERKTRANWAARWRSAIVAAAATGLLWTVSIPDAPKTGSSAPPVLDLRRDAGGRDSVTADE
jgi:hypothetical protein